MRNVPHSLTYLNTWHLLKALIGEIMGPLRDAAFLGEGCHGRGQPLSIHRLILFPVCFSALLSLLCEDKLWCQLPAPAITPHYYRPCTSRTLSPNKPFQRLTVAPVFYHTNRKVVNMEGTTAKGGSENKTGSRVKRQLATPWEKNLC